MSLNSDVGCFAERLAAENLESQGYKIMDYNYKRPWGEIDIVAHKDKTVIFIEVKANRGGISGFEPELRADWSKMRKVVRTARTYLLEKKYDEEQEWQIDIMSITFNQDKQVANIKHFKNIDVEY